MRIELNLTNLAVVCFLRGTHGGHDVTPKLTMHGLSIRTSLFVDLTTALTSPPNVK